MTTQNHRNTQLNPMPLPKPSARTRRNPFTVLVAGFYVLTILAAAIFGGSLLYNWAFDRNYGEGIQFTQIQSTIAQSGAVAPLLDASGQPVPINPEDAGTVAVNIENLPSSRVNILLLGVDTRPDETDAPRTDTMMLMTLDPNTGVAGMLSLPRDLWVPIPGYDLTWKINSAYTIGENRRYPGGGSQLAKDTVSAFIGQPIQYSLRVDFDGFVEMVDLIGGIDMVVPKTIHDEQYPTIDYGYMTFHIDAGTQHLDGATALMYARTRNTDDDYNRAGRQQQVIQAVLDKVLRASMIPTLIAKAPQLFTTLRGSIDTDMPLTEAISIARFVGQDALTEVRQLVLDNRFGDETYTDDGAWILLPNRERIRLAMRDFFAAPTEIVTVDAAITTTAATADGLVEGAAQLDAQTIRVEILNGAGYPGAAALTQEILEARGWNVVSIGDADRLDYRRTLVVNYRTPATLIEKISADLAIQPTVSKLTGLANEQNIDLRIIIGQDYIKNVLNQEIP
ncbi:MAG: LCP family protein [Caldilineaceae bacterium]|nr:LCP family protein [Caldilineaceae bacterium]MBP8109960.1 LCP family protein [Caldilineaceae bacterium]MBP8124978.1 LCP family protein [Caldilineaceae bacterium]MBP9074767.1 LCP family protein [Caldilineaceae bacterium]